ncbi:helix-turn-helix domain-containing protein [Anaeromyxobacter dehalogenans]|uniref:helix-turn-helix domain-containing protein n=1 Tax=Anaeromyxobacter dehalogenans TaxID=161493 RepID=UPI0018DD1107
MNDGLDTLRSAGPAASSASCCDGCDASPAVTVSEAARLLRLDPRTVRSMLRAGDLDGNQKGHAIRISRSSVLEWLRGKRRVPRSKR